MYTLIARLADHNVHDDDEENNDDEHDEYEDEDDDRFCQKKCSGECGYCILEHLFHFDVFCSWDCPWILWDARFKTGSKLHILPPTAPLIHPPMHWLGCSSALPGLQSGAKLFFSTSPLFSPTFAKETFIAVLTRETSR